MTAPQIRIAANALIVKDEKTLLVEFDDETGLHYNFPGGGVAAGETLEEAVRREVREETCLDVAVERLLLIVESVASRNTNVIGGRRVPWNELRFFFLCSPANAEEAHCPEVFDAYQTGVRWVPLDSLPSVAVLPQVGTELLAALANSAPPLIVANPKA